MPFRSFLRLIALITGFAPALSGCSLADEDPTDHTHTYRYEAFDTSGRLVALGDLSIVFQSRVAEDDCQVRCVAYDLSGTRDISLTGDSSSASYQVGRGDLTGWYFESGAVAINLNPDVEDGNTYLRGDFREGQFDRFSGTWDDTWGPTGTFSANEK